MSAPRPLSSREKKTIRDRRAQVARRARQLARVQQLEEQVEHCRREHGKHIDLEQEVSSLRAALDFATRECEDLRSRQTAASHLLGPERNSMSIPPAYGVNRNQDLGEYDRTSTSESADNWALSPCHIPTDDIAFMLTPWFLCPAVVLPLTDVPSPYEILSGSHTNPLTHAIHIALANAYTCKLAEPERLSWGWICYIYTKWALQPTPARYTRLPRFLHPTELQRSRPHSPVIDLWMWPRLRDNFITTYGSSSEGLLCGIAAIVQVLKVSWPRDEPVLEPDPEDPSHMIIREDFFATFTNLENWTVTATFVKNFPNLARGIDWEPATNLPSFDGEDPAELRLKAV